LTGEIERCNGRVQVEPFGIVFGGTAVDQQTRFTRSGREGLAACSLRRAPLPDAQPSRAAKGSRIRVSQAQTSSILRRPSCQSLIRRSILV
jgi:hypothetical protein